MAQISEPLQPTGEDTGFLAPALAWVTSFGHLESEQVDERAVSLCNSNF